MVKIPPLLYRAGLAVFVVLVAVLSWQVYRWYRSPPALSEEIFEQVVPLGHRLRKNLEDARVVIPGRPHPFPFLAHSRQYKARITRRVIYHCSTNSLRFRGGPVSPEPAVGTTRVVCLGDSITFGHGVEDDQAFPAVMHQLLRRDNYEVINAGTPGERSDGAVTVLHQTVLRLRPQVVLLCVGVNDITDHFQPHGGRLRPAERVGHYRRITAALRRNLDQAVEACRRAKVEVVLVVPPITSFFPFPEYPRVCKTIREVGRELGVQVVDLERIFREREYKNGLVLQTAGDRQRLLSYREGRPAELLSVAVSPVRTQHIHDSIYDYLDRHPGQKLSIDESHPNAEGHRLAAQVLARALRDGTKSRRTRSRKLLQGKP